MKTIAIIQARMGSSRLPGKVLVSIAGKPLLFRVIERVSAAKQIDDVVVATTTEEQDDVLVERLKTEPGIKTFRGSKNDVLGRIFCCAKLFEADNIVRITADDPLKDPQIIEEAICLLNEHPSLDYCSNTIKPSYPEGLDVEVMRFSALERAYNEAQLKSEREHVTPYIWKHPELFNIRNFKFERDLSNWRWTVDNSRDLEFIRIIFEEFKSLPLVSYQEVIAWVENNPEVLMINSDTSRNEGYLKSIEAEKL